MQYSVAVNQVIKGCAVCKDALKELGYEGVFTQKYLADILDLSPNVIRFDMYGRDDKRDGK